MVGVPSECVLLTTPPCSMFSDIMFIMKSVVAEFTPQNWANTIPPALWMASCYQCTIGCNSKQKREIHKPLDASRFQPRQTTQHQPAVCSAEQGSGHGHMHKVCTPHTYYALRIIPTPHLHPQTHTPLTYPRTPHTLQTA